MPNIFCDIAGKIYRLDYIKVSTKVGKNYHGILYTTPIFRYYFTTVIDKKIIFIPASTAKKRQDAITKAILNYEEKGKENLSLNFH